MERDAKRRPVTLKDIARETGLSVTAVSQALNGSGHISPETVIRVKKAADRLHYMPNTIAKSLRVASTRTIGVVAADSSMSFFAGVVQGIEETVSAAGYNIILCNTGRSREKEWDALGVLINKRIDGLVLAASMLTSREDVERIRAFGIPFVYLVRRTDSDEANFVVNDNRKGAESLTGYLVDTGSSRVHFLDLGAGSPSGRERLEGYRKALEARGIPFDVSLVSHVGHEISDGRTAMRSLLEASPRPTCVLCGCDEIAIGALDACLSAGLRVPGDVRIAGYDDIDYAAYLRVPLTTVRQPRRRIGNLGAEMLLELIEKGGPREARHVVLDPELVIRDSA